jgi:hypothetical protein
MPRFEPQIVAQGSVLLAEEYFASGDERFLGELLRSGGASKLASLAERWYADARPFARKMLLAYVDDGCDRPDHKALVKRLFKLAEKKADDEAMGHFMMAFDSLAGRTLTQVGARWDAVKKEAVPIMGLRGNVSVPERLAKDEKGKQATSERFSRATRRYLARRAFRYFRRLGRSDVDLYGATMRAVLPLYRDEMLSTPEKLLDAWGLMHALYGFSSVLAKEPGGIQIRADRALSELEPAPYFAAAWEGVLDELFAMMLEAKSRTVRTWALALLRSKYDVRALGFAEIRRLLTSPHEELQRFGAELLTTAAGLESLPIGEWLALLRIERLEVVALVCDAIKKHVTPARLTLAQCVQLACARVAPVATLGLEWAKGKPVASAADLDAILPVTRAGVPSVRAEGARWVASLMKTLPFVSAEHARDLCDAPFADARAEGLACVEGSRFKDELSLWFALTESPYDDVRAFVVKNAAAWKAKAEPATLSHVWSSALLAVHRGGAAKRRVPREIADRIVTYPEEAPKLLPVLGVALRSVRPTERTVALASLARAVTENEALRGLVREHLPEISFTGRVTT